MTPWLSLWKNKFGHRKWCIYMDTTKDPDLVLSDEQMENLVKQYEEEKDG